MFAYYVLIYVSVVIGFVDLTCERFIKINICLRQSLSLSCVRSGQDVKIKIPTNPPTPWPERESR